MLPRKIIGTLVALSFAAVAAAQSPPAKPKPPQKPAARQKAPPKPKPAPAPAPAPAPRPATDVQLRTSYTTGAQVSENRTYIQGARQRFEFPGITMIAQCDLKRSLRLHDATKQYLIVSTEAPPPAAPAPAEPSAETEMAAQMAAMTSAGRKPPKDKGGVVTETITLTDTGERKQMFGLEARHIRMVVVRQPGEGACETTITTVDTDGWYVDLPAHESCSIDRVEPAPPPAAGQDSCTDRVVTERAGRGDLGFALSTTMTTTVADGKQKGGDKDPDVTSMSMEVTELNVTSLDKALFEVPPGYTEVKDYTSLLPSLAAGGTLSDAVFGSIADGTSNVSPKKTGIIRVGIVAPANKSGRELQHTGLLASLPAGFAHLPFESVPLAGATAADLDRDAAGKACDYILVSEITEIKTSKPNRVGGMLKKVTRDSPSPSEIHEVRVDYKLYALGDPDTPRFASSVKASSGGGFGVRSALRVAAFAGQMYLTMGMGSGLMGMMGQGSPFGGLGGPGEGAGRGRMNPGMSAAMSIISAGSRAADEGGSPGAPEDQGARVTETVHAALAKASTEAAAELKKRTSAAGGKKE
ncbi:MAG: hypothetical protein WEB50_08620 [Vicinamibacterales bacterium]